MSKDASLFLVDDNKDLRDSLGEYLELNDFIVKSFSSAVGVLEALAVKPPDLIILDIMLQEGDGFSIAKKIRKISRVPIIFLTARESEQDRITGFELGGDDYVVKPFSMKEFVLRVKALLRRTGFYDSANLEIPEWILGDETMTIDEQSHIAIINGVETSLTITEWRILRFMVSNEGKALSRDDILSACLSYSFQGYDRTVDTHIKNLRSKINSPGWIETVTKVGYRFKGIRKLN
ncbi:MAG: response regulator transcription factor [Spirochaetales bacterium]|nr:response regulator transcription factor [Spirochaetales bacterium]